MSCQSRNISLFDEQTVAMSWWWEAVLLHKRKWMMFNFMLSVSRARVKTASMSDVASIHGRHLTFLVKEKKKSLRSQCATGNTSLSSLHTLYSSSSVNPVIGFPSPNVTTAAPTHQHQNWQEKHTRRTWPSLVIALYPPFSVFQDISQRNREHFSLL